MNKNTYEVATLIPPKAVLVSLIANRMKNVREEDEHSLGELQNLAETAGAEVLGVIRQVKEAPDPRWLIGKGKVEEVKAMADELGANTVIFDQELSGAQVRNLESALDAKIIDRTQLILDIFAQRARTREGQLQVELAQLSYLLPRLSGQGTNLSRLGGGIGTRGPGETKLETDRRHIRDRIHELKEQLSDVTRHRTLHRERRRKSGVYQAALVGYTNAGKSTLLRQLTGADVYVQNQLFATLDPTSRNLKLPSGKEIVLTDTVGFIQNLPHDLVAAFRATLEEVNEADLVLHVVDSSSPMREEQMRVVEEVLTELGASGKERLTVFNKIDLCDPSEADMLSAEGEYVRISAFNEADLERFIQTVENRMMGDTVHYRIPMDAGHLLSAVYRLGEVVEQETTDDYMEYKVRVNRTEFEKSGYQLAAYEHREP